MKYCIKKVIINATIDRNPLHTCADITGMLNGILVLFHQVRIDRLANGGDT